VPSRQARRAGSSGHVASLRRTLPRGSSAARRRDGSAARRRDGSAARSAATRCAKNSGRGTPDAPLHSRCRLERQARAVSSAPQRLCAAREPLHDGLTQSQEGARTAQHARARCTRPPRAGRLQARCAATCLGCCAAQWPAARASSTGSLRKVVRRPQAQCSVFACLTRQTAQVAALPSARRARS
jgi:hypothetical protein